MYNHDSCFLIICCKILVERIITVLLISDSFNQIATDILKSAFVARESFQFRLYDQYLITYLLLYWSLLVGHHIQTTIICNFMVNNAYRYLWISGNLSYWLQESNFVGTTMLDKVSAGRLGLLPAVSATWQLNWCAMMTSSHGKDFRMTHDEVIKWKYFPRYWPFVWGIHRSPVNSPHKGQWRGAWMFSLICAWINGWVNNLEDGDLRHQRAHYGDMVMWAISEGNLPWPVDVPHKG